jgi:hypothetical protein
LGLVVVAVALWVWTREPRQVRPPAAAEAPAAQTEARPAQVLTAGRGERPAAVAPVGQAPPPGALRPGLLVAVTDVGGGPIADARLIIGDQEVGRTGADAPPPWHLSGCPARASCAPSPPATRMRAAPCGAGPGDAGVAAGQRRRRRGRARGRRAAGGGRGGVHR